MRLFGSERGVRCADGLVRDAEGGVCFLLVGSRVIGSGLEG